MLSEMSSRNLLDLLNASKVKSVNLLSVSNQQPRSKMSGSLILRPGSFLMLSTMLLNSHNAATSKIKALQELDLGVNSSSMMVKTDYLRPLMILQMILLVLQWVLNQSPEIFFKNHWQSRQLRLSVFT